MYAILSPLVGSILLASSLVVSAEASERGNCGPGDHWVRSHERRAFMRADGTPVAAAHVSAHCHLNPSSYAVWAERLRPGTPLGWLFKTEKQRTWTDEEKERVLEALSSLPKELLIGSINGIYRFKQSESYDKNPASGHDTSLVLYDSAFDKNQNLARVLGHEFAHRGCTTLPRAVSAFDLPSMERLQIGKTTAAELRAQFGEPQQIYPLSKNEDAWFYSVREGNAVVQKISFVLNHENSTLLTVTWIPTGQDPLNLKENALAYFKNASFQLRRVQQAARHEYSNDAVYFDTRSSVSVRVNQDTGAVVAVAFGGNPSVPSLVTRK